MLDTVSYQYQSNDGWGDKLTSYDGKAITYDEIGNMTSFDGKTHSWQGRELTRITTAIDTYSYKYNAEGIRTEKTVNGITTKYFLNGSQVVAETTDGNTIWFIYDSQGSRVALVENGQTFYYMYNLQGDVIGLVDETTGEVVATYEYDAWGRCILVQNKEGYTVGTDNPFRYRGYYYDEETGLYYLNSRYYSPEFGRFINADGQLNNDLLGSNLYTYCGNNPVIRVDSSGQGWWIFACAVVGGTVSGIAKVVSNIALGKPLNEGIFGAIAGGAVYGGILSISGNIWGAGFSSAAAESIVNESISYSAFASYNGDIQQDLTEDNVKKSIVNVAKDTVFNGLIYSLAGEAANKIVPTNNWWFKPKKFKSSFVGRYAMKSDAQTLTQSGLLIGVDCVKGIFNECIGNVQVPSVMIFDD